MAMVKKGDAYAAGGTLMFDLNGEVASTVLTPDIGKLEAKGIKSVDARITNIKPYLPHNTNLGPARTSKTTCSATSLALSA